MDEAPLKTAVEIETETNEQIAQRKNKLQVLRVEGQAYPNDFKRDTLAADIHEQYAATTPDELLRKPTVLTVAGRIMTRRIMGKASFAHVQDMTCNR